MLQVRGCRLAGFHVNNDVLSVAIKIDVELVDLQVLHLVEELDAFLYEFLRGGVGF